MCLIFSQKYKKCFKLCCTVKYCIIFAERRDTSIICKKVIPQFKKVLTDFELLICWAKQENLKLPKANNSRMKIAV